MRDVKKLLSIIQKELDFSSGLVDDEAYKLLPEWSRKAFEASCKTLRVKQNQLSNDTGPTPTVQDVIDIGKTARNVTDTARGMVWNIRKHRGLD